MPLAKSFQDQRAQRRAANKSARLPSIFDFAALRLDDYGRKAGQSPKSRGVVAFGLSTNTRAPNASRDPSYVTLTYDTTAGQRARLSDKPLLGGRITPDLEGMEGAFTPRPKKRKGVQAEREFYDDITTAFEEPLLPALPNPRSTGPLPHPSSDLIHAIIYFGTRHYAEQGQLSATPKRSATTQSAVDNSDGEQPILSARRARSKGMGRPPAQSLPHVDEEDDEIVDTSVECISKTNKGSRRKDQVDVNMFKTFDATAATAIGMIMQELVMDSLRSSLTPPTLNPMVSDPLRPRYKRKGPYRYTSPSDILLKDACKVKKRMKKRRDVTMAQAEDPESSNLHITDAGLVEDVELNEGRTTRLKSDDIWRDADVAGDSI